MSARTPIRLLCLGRQAALARELEAVWQALCPTEPALSSISMQIVWVNSQAQALKALRAHTFQAIVIEVDNHRQHRTRFCQTLRHRFPYLRIIAACPEPVKNSRFAFSDTIRLPLAHKAGLGLLRRICEKEDARDLRVGRIHLDTVTRTVRGPRGVHSLPPKQCALLRVLLLHGEEIVSRERIMADVWETEFLEDTRTLDVHMRWLREKIEPDPSHPIYLLTIRGQGFRLTAN
ncbi:MAG: winged helix-turn-helix domain-containing protein [Caldilineaceae bacterium]|nr:winged helix-turn-helix domain-containing protein [Caldilineaceae bacterium]